MEAIPKSDIKSVIKSDIRFDISIKRTTWIGHKARKWWWRWRDGNCFVFSCIMLIENFLLSFSFSKDDMIENTQWLQELSHRTFSFCAVPEKALAIDKTWQTLHCGGALVGPIYVASFATAASAPVSGHATVACDGVRVWRTDGLVLYAARTKALLLQTS